MIYLRMEPRIMMVLVAGVIVLGVSGQEIQDLDLDLDAGDTAVLQNQLNNPDNVKQVTTFKDECRQTAGEEAVRELERAQAEFMPCVTDIINIQKLQHEIKMSIPRGELDTVFKKYCRKRDEIMNCVEAFFGAVEVCLDDNQRQDLNTTRRAIDAGIEFICYKEGDRIALFMGENGEGCLKNHTDNIKKCVEDSVPEVKEAGNDPQEVNINDFAINEDNCLKVQAMHRCVVKYTELCDDPTPSNMLDSLITQMLKVTPCLPATAASTDDGAPSTTAALLPHHFLPHLLTLLAAALTAANFLL